jgi:hypothetical protein
MARGFVYLAALVDWFSRRVLAHRVSITMQADFCVEALEEALAKHGKPSIFNTDQGSQFTSEVFTGVLIANKIAIGMMARARGATTSSSSASGNRSNMKRSCAVNAIVLGLNECDALLKMRVGPSKSACRSRLQTAASCIGQEPLW